MSTTTTDRNVQRLLNRVSIVIATISTVLLLYLFSLSCHVPSLLQNPSNNHLDSLTLSRTPFPHSSCDASHRRNPNPNPKSPKLSNSSYAPIFRSLPLLSSRSRVLLVSAAPGHAVVYLKHSGVVDVTAVDVLDVPPFVRRADPHNLPFFDSVFDFAFSDRLDNALFPARYVSEMERTVRKGGVCVVVVGRCEVVEEVVGLFRRSEKVEMRDLTFQGEERTMFLMRVPFGCGWILLPEGAGAATVDLRHPSIEQIPWSYAPSTEIEAYFERGGRSSGEELLAAPEVAGLSSSIS